MDTIQTAVQADQITGNPTDLTLNDLTPSDALAFLATHYSEATALSIALSLLNVRAAFPALKGNEALIDDFVDLVINSERMARADVKLPGIAFNAWVKQYEEQSGTKLSLTHRLDLIGTYLEFSRESGWEPELTIDAYCEAAFPAPAAAAPAPVVQEPVSTPEPRTLECVVTIPIKWEAVNNTLDEMLAMNEQRGGLISQELVSGIFFNLDIGIADDGQIIFDAFIDQVEPPDLLCDFPPVPYDADAPGLYRTWERPITVGQDMYLVRVNVIDPDASAPFDPA